jgi:hypothetical protein
MGQPVKLSESLVLDARVTGEVADSIPGPWRTRRSALVCPAWA